MVLFIPIWYLSDRLFSVLIWTLIIYAILLTFLVFGIIHEGNEHLIPKYQKFLALTGVTLFFLITEAAGIFVFPMAHRPGLRLSGWVGWIGIISSFIVTIGILTTIIISIVNASRRVLLLDILSRRIFRQPLSPGFGLIGEQLSATDTQNAFPSAYPPEEFRDFQFYGSTEELSRGAAWAEGLRKVNSRSRPRRGAPTPYMTTVGFVQLRNKGVLWGARSLRAL